MIALTVRQPYASLIATGIKTIELRTWATDHRGDLAIHSSARWAPGGADLVWDARTRDRAIPPPTFAEHWPLGALVCVVRLVDIRRATKRDADHAIVPARWINPPMLAWILEEPRITQARAVKGRLGLWEVDGALVRLV